MFDESDIERALESVRATVTTTVSVIGTHRVTIVGGLEEATAVNSIATYLIGAGILHAIRTDLALASEFLGQNLPTRPQFHLELTSLVGATNDLAREFIDSQRNPWFGEGIGHLLLNLSRDLEDLAPPGRIHVLSQIHSNVKASGLDLVGLYEELHAGIGLSVGEAKVSANNITNHIGDTAELFSEVDSGKRDSEIRSHVQLLAVGLSDELRAHVTGGFWHERRAYHPVVAYSSASAFQPYRRRTGFAALNVQPDQVRLVCVALNDFDGFFDGIANSMRALAEQFADGD